MASENVDRGETDGRRLRGAFKPSQLRWEIANSFRIDSALWNVDEMMRDLWIPAVDWSNASQAMSESFLRPPDWTSTLAKLFRTPCFGIPDPFASLASVFRESAERLKDVLLEPIRRLRELPPHVKEAVLLIAKCGWWWDCEIPLPGLWNVRNMLSEGEVEEVEEGLAEHFESRLDEIEASIVATFPHRAQFIRSAFDAHRRQEYTLSILALFAQAEGICHEVLGLYLFSKKDKRPCTASYVDEFEADTFKAAYLSPLGETLPINASERERPQDFAGLNRHTVMHGESLEHGTRTNSLKAISLMNYLAQMLPVDEEQREEDTSGSAPQAECS